MVWHLEHLWNWQLNMASQHYQLAKECIRNRIIREWVVNFIKYDRGYREPIDLFNSTPTELSPKMKAKLHKLYSRVGAFALMDTVMDRIG